MDSVLLFLFLESDGIFCLVPLLVQQNKKKMKNIGKTTLETSRGSHDQFESYKTPIDHKTASLPMIYQ